MYRLITLLQASLLAIMLAACGAAGPGPEQSAGAKEFSLRVLPESFAMGGSAEFRMSVERDAERAIVSIEADRTLLDANDLMAKEHIRHLGVTQAGAMVGMISVRDLVVFLTNLPRK